MYQIPHELESQGQCYVMGKYMYLNIERCLTTRLLMVSTMMDKKQYLNQYGFFQDEPYHFQSHAQAEAAVEGIFSGYKTFH